MVTLEDLYSGTHNGLDIILYFYPQAKDVAGKNNTPFRLRESDKTPSAFIKEIKGVWRLTDFGDSDQSRSPIDIAMSELNMKFGEAIYHLAGLFNIAGTVINPEINKAKIERRPATDSEPDGYFTFKKKKVSDSELKIIGPKVKEEHCTLLNWVSLEYYQRTKMDDKSKQLMTTIVSSNDHYPIFMRECFWTDDAGKENSFYKIYQPLNADKAFRFFYQGTKPQKFINGLYELKKQYLTFNANEEKSQRDSYPGEPDNFVYKMQKLPEAFICSGERDALCIKALRHNPIWFNSETYNLSDSEYFEITKLVDKIYNIPDIDNTGVRRGMMLAMKFLDINTVWLPEKLKTYTDNRRRPRKDLRDFVEIWPDKKDFENLLNLAMPAKFWEYTTDKGPKRLEINTDFLFYFLKCHGFATMADLNSKTGYMFVRVQNNIVKKIDFSVIRSFLRSFVRERYLPIDIRNLVNNSTRISENTMNGLEEIELDFTDFTPNSQYFFFPNETWEVTGEKIIQYRPDAVSRYVWDSEVIPHNVKRLDPAFKISRNEDGDFDIRINPNHKSNFLRVLINTSRVHWHKEFEDKFRDNYDSQEAIDYREKYHFSIDGAKLEETDIEEQKQHLINKIFALGYLLHRHKSEHRAWVPFAMDNKISESEDSNGGSGKSFVLKVPRLFMNTVTLSGRNPKLTENPHLYENVNKHTDYILIDDADKYIPFGFFFDSVTGGINPNPKFRASYEIPFEDSAKIAITSNFTLDRFDSSTERRILYMVFSDWYHQKTADNGYRETYTIYDDFKKDLFRNKYSEEEWNSDINIIVDCEQFYLSTIEASVKIDPPMTNVLARNQRAVMTDMFYDWASIYFHKDSENCNTFISKEKALTEFSFETKQNKWTMNKFSKAIKAFCKYSEYIIAYNPIELCNSDRRIIKKVEGKSKEMIFIQTKEELPKEVLPEKDPF